MLKCKGPQVDKSQLHIDKSMMSKQYQSVRNIEKADIQFQKQKQKGIAQAPKHHTKN